MVLFFSNNMLAQSVTLNTIHDITIFSENNFNSDGAGFEFYIGRTNGGNLRRSLIKFNLSSIPVGATINSVILNVICSHKPFAGPSNLVELHKCIADWGEGTSVSSGSGAPATLNDATWTCSFFDGVSACAVSWASAGASFSPTVSSSVTVDALGSYTFPNSAQLVLDVQGWVNAPASNFGWVLRGNESSLQSARGFKSREQDPTATALTINYTTAACTTNTWTGAVNTAWETAGNWSCGTVPDDPTMDVIINTGTVNLNSNRTCRSISIQSGAIVNITPGFNLTVVH